MIHLTKTLTIICGQGMLQWPPLSADFSGKALFLRCRRNRAVLVDGSVGQVTFEIPY